MGSQTSSSAQPRDDDGFEEVWASICNEWWGIVLKQCFKQDSFIMFLHKQTKELRYAKVDKVIDDNKAFVQIADGVFLEIERANAIWGFLPNSCLEKAKVVVEACFEVKDILRLTSIEGLKVVVLSSAAHRLFGGAAVTSGLATLGGGSLAAGGFGMVGGIVVVAAAPSMLGAHTLYVLSNSFENNSATPAAVAVGSLGGAAAGCTTSVVMLSNAGVAGLSASGITSGLASLGGGTVAAGGAGMLGGLAVVTGAAAGITVAVGGVTWLISHAVVQGRLETYRCKMIDIAVKNAFEVLLG